MTLAMERHIEWTSPAALWDHVGSTPDTTNRRIFRTPAILRFASDSFMQELIDMMNVDYQYLDLVPKGRDESGRGPFWVRRHDEYDR